jgi:hypothetical protein
MSVKKFRTLKDFREWVQNEAEQGPAGPILGVSPGGAAKELNLARERVHQLIADGVLDAIKVYRGSLDGRARNIYISRESLDAEKRRRGLMEDEKQIFQECG